MVDFGVIILCMTEKKEKSALRLAMSIGQDILGYIVGPIVIFGGLGHLADGYFETGNLLLLLGILVAFVATNLLLFKKVREVLSEMRESK